MIRTGCILVPCASPALAAETGTSDFVYVSDLAAQGFAPFATSSTGGATFGMHDGPDFHLCFIADNMTDAAVRQHTLVAELNGDNRDRTVPNIPVACVLTQ